MGMKVMKDLRKKLDAVKEEMQQVGEKAIKEAFQELFAKYPLLEAVKWEQYTPYFNDGEACTFSVGEMRYRLKGMSEEGGEYEDGFYTGVSDFNDDLSEECYNWKNKRPTEHPLEKMTAELNEDLSAIESVEEMLESVFGDHQEITVFRDGTIEQNDYEHD